MSIYLHHIGIWYMVDINFCFAINLHNRKLFQFGNENCLDNIYIPIQKKEYLMAYIGMIILDKILYTYIPSLERIYNVLQYRTNIWKLFSTYVHTLNIVI